MIGPFRGCLDDFFLGLHGSVNAGPPLEVLLDFRGSGCVVRWNSYGFWVLRTLCQFSPENKAERHVQRLKSERKANGVARTF